MPKIIVELSEEDYKDALNDYEEYMKYKDLAINSVSYAIANGTPLAESDSKDLIRRKDAIEWVENVRTLNEYYHPHSKNNHLIDCDTAIDHLKQVPSVLPKQPEFCEDCVSRKSMVLRVKELIDNPTYTIEMLKADVENLPSVLPKEPTTKNDLGVDCISRQIISDYVESHIQEINTGYGDLNKHTNSILRMIVDYVENLPSVTSQEPRKGHWIETAEEYYKAINEKGGGVNEDTDFFTDDIACSECLAKFSVIDNEAERFDFCPCCGSNNR